MAGRHKIAGEEEFDGDGSRVIGEVDGLEIAVFRIGGEYHALANYCVHQGGPLCEGELGRGLTVDADGWERIADEPTNVLCPWHGWVFDVETGRNVDDDRYAVPSYDVEVEDGDVFVLR